MNTSEPLGLPRGSVRAILALLTVGVTMGVNAVLVLNGGTVDAGFLGVGTLVLGYYFGTRQSVTEEPAPPAPAFGDED